MTSKLFIVAMAFSAFTGARAQYVYSFTNGVVIPDNSATGYQDSRTLSDIPGVISDVNVNLELSGGFNGDLYAWLSHGDGLAMLLNRVGLSTNNSVGYADRGFGPDSLQNPFTLDDQAAQDVHSYRAGFFVLNGNGQLTGVWQPDGRLLDPASAGYLFDGAPRTNQLSGFNGLSPNGTWMLFVADVSGAGISTLKGWGLEISVVPEPGTISLWLLGCAVLMWRLLSGRRRAGALAGR